MSATITNLVPTSGTTSGTTWANASNLWTSPWNGSATYTNATSGSVGYVQVSSFNLSNYIPPGADTVYLQGSFSVSFGTANRWSNFTVELYLNNVLISGSSSTWTPTTSLQSVATNFPPLTYAQAANATISVRLNLVKNGSQSSTATVTSARIAVFNYNSDSWNYIPI